MWTRKAVDFAIVVVVAMIFIFVGGSSIYMHNNQKPHEKNPIFFSFGIAMAGAGGSILSSLVLGLLPGDVKEVIRNAKSGARF